MSALSDKILALSKPYLGPAAESFLARQCKGHLNIEMGAITTSHLKDLSTWVERSGALIMEPSKAAELASRKNHHRLVVQSICDAAGGWSARLPRARLISGRFVHPVVNITPDVRPGLSFVGAFSGQPRGGSSTFQCSSFFCHAPPPPRGDRRQRRAALAGGIVRAAIADRTCTGRHPGEGSDRRGHLACACARGAFFRKSSRENGNG